MKRILGYLVCGVLVGVGLSSALAAQKRDPFIPLVDEKGIVRTTFVRPSKEQVLPQITLMGIGKIGTTYYAIIDAEWYTQGQTLKGKELLLKKIEDDKVILKFGEKEFAVKLDTTEK